MNQGPYLLPKARFGYRLGNAELIDSTVSDGLWCSLEGCHMGTHAERVAIKAQVSRADQDRFALDSHQRAIAAIDAGRFVEEIVAVPIRRGKEEVAFDTDEGPRRDTTLEALARLKPVFALPEPEPGTPADSTDMADGTVTAGNAPGITDGAAATVVASERAVERLGLKPLARIVGYSQAEVEPRWLFLAPVKGVRKLLARIDMPLEALRPDRDQRGLRGAGSGRRPRAGLRLVEGQRQRRGHCAGPPHRGQWSAYRCHVAPRAAEERCELRPGDPVPGWRWVGRDGLRTRLTPRTTHLTPRTTHRSSNDERTGDRH